jgi:uncharacterized membrane protein (DUF373 family)
MSRLLERRLRLVDILSRSERIIYYGAAFALILTVGMIFASAAISAVEAIGAEPLEEALKDTSLIVLDRVLLIFIFVESLNTIGIVVRERQIVAEPFLLIGLIAVVRRILLVTAEAEQTIGTEKFLNLVLELGVLTGLVIALSGALYVTRRAERPHNTEGQGINVPRSNQIW